MELYGFGFNGCGQIQAGTTGNIETPVCMRRADEIRVLWVSWCDAVIALQNEAGLWTVEYLGVGLTPLQKMHLEERGKDNLDNKDKDASIQLFGMAMHEGLRGYVVSGSETLRGGVSLFATDTELECGIEEVQTFPVHDGITVSAIEMLSGGEVLLSMSLKTTNEAEVILLHDLASLRQHLTSHSPPQSNEPLASFKLSCIRSNSTTAIALDQDGNTHTYTRDPRYPQCLGRPHEGVSTFAAVPYLSEVRIRNVACGGYLTAAVSHDGELYLWGQACPDAAGELHVLKQAHTQSRADIVPASNVTAEDEQDEYVKCLTVKIDGREADVQHVAVGHGHVLVAAKAQSFHEKRTVFAAGDGSKGQLGLGTGQGYASVFMEVEVLRNKRIVQMAASGWTSFIVVGER